jgi:hypothetical protein
MEEQGADPLEGAYNTADGHLEATTMAMAAIM